MTVYRMQWENGQPFIEAGTVVIRGKRNGNRWVSFPSETKLIRFSEGSATIRAAIEANILGTILLCMPGIFSPNRKSKPWLLISRLARIQRLYERLLADRLVERIDENSWSL